MIFVLVVVIYPSTFALVPSLALLYGRGWIFTKSVIRGAILRSGTFVSPQFIRKFTLPAEYVKL